MKNFNQMLANRINMVIQEKVAALAKVAATGPEICQFPSDSNSTTRVTVDPECGLTVTTEPKYSQSIADALGINNVRTDVRMIDWEKMPEVVEKATTGNLMKGWRVIAATPTTKDRVLVSMSEKDIERFKLDKWFAIKDAIRLAPLLTPCDHGIQTKSMRIMFVNDFEFGTGDGQAVMSQLAMESLLEMAHMPKIKGNGTEPKDVLFESLAAFLAMEDNGKPESRQLQFRSVLSSRKAIMKGTIIQGETLFGIDMVCPMSCVKGGNFATGEVYCANDIPFGVVEMADERNASVGYQVSGQWPDKVWDKLEEMDGVKIAFMREMMRDPETYARQVQAISDVSPAHADLLAMIANFCKGVGDNSFMHSELVTELIEDYVSALNTAMCVSGVTKAKSYMLIHDIGVRPGIAIVNPSAHLKEEESWSFRNPFVKLSDGAVIHVIKDERCPVGSIIMHPETLRAGGADADGDFIQVIQKGITAPHVETLIEHCRNLAPEGNGRATAGNPPETLAEAIVEMMKVSIGPVANVKDDYGNFIWMLRKRYASATTDAEKASIIAMAEKAKGIQATLGAELQARVDFQKRFTTVDTELVKEARKLLTDWGFGDQDRAHRTFANGSVKGWRKWDRNHEDTVARLGKLFGSLSFGKPALPSTIVGESCRIAKRFKKLDLPVPDWAPTSNSVFIRMITPRPNEKAVPLAVASYNDMVEALKAEVDTNGEGSATPMQMSKLKIRSLMTTLPQEELDAFVAKWWEITTTRGSKSGWLIMGDEFLRLMKADYTKPKVEMTEAVIVGLHFVAKAIPGTNELQPVRVRLSKNGIMDAAGKMCQALEIEGVKGAWKIERAHLTFQGDALALIVGDKKQDGTPAKRSIVKIIGACEPKA